MFGTIPRSSDLLGRNPKAKERQVRPAQIPPAPVLTAGKPTSAEVATLSAPFEKRGPVRPRGFEPAKLRSMAQRDWLTNWPTDLLVASIPELPLPIREEELATISPSALRWLLCASETEQVRPRKRVRLQKRYLCPCDACFGHRGVRGDAAFFALALRPTPRQPCCRSLPYPHSECAGLARGLRRAVDLRHGSQFWMLVGFRTNQRRSSQLPRSKCPRSSCPRPS